MGKKLNQVNGGRDDEALKRQAAEAAQMAHMRAAQENFHAAWSHLAAASQIIVTTSDGVRHMGQLSVVVDGWLVVRTPSGGPRFHRLDNICTIEPSALAAPVS